MHTVCPHCKSNLNVSDPSMAIKRRHCGGVFSLLPDDERPMRQPQPIVEPITEEPKYVERDDRSIRRRTRRPKEVDYSRRVFFLILGIFVFLLIGGIGVYVKMIFGPIIDRDNQLPIVGSYSRRPKNPTHEKTARKGRRQEKDCEHA